MLPVIIILAFLLVYVFFSSLPDGLKMVAEKQQYLIPILLIANLLDWDSTCRGAKKFGAGREGSFLIRKVLEQCGVGRQFLAIKLGLGSVALVVLSFWLTVELRLVAVLILVLASVSNYLQVLYLPSSESPVSKSPVL